MNLAQVVKRPIVTEKSTQLGVNRGEYCFQVARWANKKDVKKAVEMFFGVKVDKVKTTITKGKTRKVARSNKKITRANWKKAIVKVAKGEKIEVFENK